MSEDPSRPCSSLAMGKMPPFPLFIVYGVVLIKTKSQDFQWILLQTGILIPTTKKAVSNFDIDPNKVPLSMIRLCFAQFALMIVAFLNWGVPSLITLSAPKLWQTRKVGLKKKKEKKSWHHIKGCLLPPCLLFSSLDMWKQHSVIKVWSFTLCPGKDVSRWVWWMCWDSVAYIKVCLCRFAAGDEVLLDDRQKPLCMQLFDKKTALLAKTKKEQKRLLAACTVSKSKMHTSLKTRTKIVLFFFYPGTLITIK